MTVCSLVSSGFPSALFAAALEGPDVRSNLNQPLRVRMAVTLRDGEELAPNCVRAVPPKRDDLPTAPGARASLLRDERGPYVLYSSAIPVTEPAVRGAVEVGCTDPVTREFVVLLDPPAINAPQVQAPLPSQPAAQTPRTPAVPPARSAEVPAPAIAAAQTRPRGVQPSVIAAAPKPVKRLNAKRVDVVAPKFTDRLSLSAPDASDSGLLGSSGRGGAGLKLSDLLTRLPQPGDAPADAEQARRMAVEQARLAAILRDEDPVAAALAKERELTERLAGMNRDLAAARAQVKSLAERNRDLERFSWLPWLAWGAAGLLALAAAFFGISAIRNAWLQRGQKQKQEQEQEQDDPWWISAPSTKVRTPVTTTVDDLYLDTIKPVPARGAAAALDTPTTMFESASVDSAHKIEVQELDRGSTSFMREFEPAPDTQPDSFSSTILQPTELQRSAQSTRFQATKVQPVKPAMAPQPPQKPGPFPDTAPSSALSTMPPLDFDLNLPPLDLDVSPPEDPSAKTQSAAPTKPIAKPPAKP